MPRLLKQLAKCQAVATPRGQHHFHWRHCAQLEAPTNTGLFVEFPVCVCQQLFPLRGGALDTIQCLRAHRLR